MQFPFEPQTKSNWLSNVIGDLKGKPIEDLDWQLSETFRVSPFAHADDIQIPLKPIHDRARNNWYINENFTVGQHYLEVNELVLSALNAGVSSLSLHIDSTCNFEELLKGVNLEWIFVHLECPTDVVSQFVQYIERQSFNSENIQCSFNWRSDVVPDKVLKSLPLAKLYSCNHQVQPKHPEQEVAALLVQAVAHMHTSSQTEGHTDQLYFIVNLTDSFYLNIAKIRALKLLWSQILAASNIPNKAAFIRAQMSQELLGEDPDMTKIKAGAQAMAACIAGVDIIHIPPSTHSNDPAFHTRIARNIHHLLQLESFMDRVIDPSAGSYYLEQLTDKIAASAWTIFQQTYEQEL